MAAVALIIKLIVDSVVKLRNPKEAARPPAILQNGDKARLKRMEDNHIKNREDILEILALVRNIHK